MTEEKALTKWCPMVRHSTDEKQPSNRYGCKSILQWNACVGSDCMMWQWHLKVKTIGNDVENSGYCGLVIK